MKKIKYSLLLLMFKLLFAQSNIAEQPAFSDFQISSERYLTDDKGNILFTNNLKLKNEIVPKIVPSERIKVNETAIDTCNQLSLAY